MMSFPYTVHFKYASFSLHYQSVVWDSVLLYDPLRITHYVELLYKNTHYNIGDKDGTFTSTS